MSSRVLHLDCILSQDVASDLIEYVIQYLSLFVKIWFVLLQYNLRNYDLTPGADWPVGLPGDRPVVPPKIITIFSLFCY